MSIFIFREADISAARRESCYARAMKRLLCFGDSNTWGYMPKTGARFPADVRWTGVLQRLLGAEWVVIEEGLNGRTTAFDYKDRPYRNGKEYLPPCLDSHAPLDLVILGLGTNDLKVEFGLTPERVAAGMEALVELVEARGVPMIVSSPPAIDESRLDYDEMRGSQAKARELPRMYRALAEKHGARFVDLGGVSASPLDGYHLDADGHRRVAEIYHRALTTL
jgi:lysophospholipase L1-like esterase